MFCSFRWTPWRAPGAFLQRPHQREEAPASGWCPGGPVAGLGVCGGAGCTERGAGASEGAQPVPAPSVVVDFGRGSPGRPGLCWQVTAGTGCLAGELGCVRWGRKQAVSYRVRRALTIEPRTPTVSSLPSRNENSPMQKPVHDPSQQQGSRGPAGGNNRGVRPRVNGGTPSVHHARECHCCTRGRGTHTLPWGQTLSPHV